MRPQIFLAIAMALPLVAIADETNPLSEYKWLKRPLVIFADTDRDPRFIRQMELLAETPEELDLRDVIILIDTDPAAKGPLREKLHPREFMLVLIGKDGRVVLRKPSPWSVRELSRAIDKIPMRQDEILRELDK